MTNFKKHSRPQPHKNNAGVDVSAGAGIIKIPDGACAEPSLQLGWDGSYVQKRFHSGRTDTQGGHHVRIGANGTNNRYFRPQSRQNNSLLIPPFVPPYHMHHGQGPHYPCCRTQSESIIDLFRMYGASITTGTRPDPNVDGGRINIFRAVIVMEPENRNFSLEIAGSLDWNESGFFVGTVDATHVEPFFGSSLRPLRVDRTGSPLGCCQEELF